MTDKNRFKFDVAISYAGEEQGIAADLYSLLQKNGLRVFFAKPYKVYLLGKHLGCESKRIYGPYSRFVVPIISKNYVEKCWPKTEFNIAKEEEKCRSSEFILPVLVDDVELEGLDSDVFYIDLRKEGTLSAAQTITRKSAECYGLEEVPVPRVWVATFGLVVHDLIEQNLLPESAPHGYPHLCDWLEKDLTECISRSPIRSFALSEASYRDGECLSVRIAFKWDPEKEPLDFGAIAWWEVLELAEFEHIYPGQSGEDFLDLR